MLTEAQKRDLDRDLQEIVDRRVEQKLSKQIPKRFTPYEGDKPNSQKELDYFMNKEPKHEFESMGEFFQSVIKVAMPGGYESDTLRNWTKKTAGYMELGQDSQGGYLVPQEFRNELLQTALESSIVRSRSTFIPMQTNSLAIPAIVDDDHSTDYFGGIVIYRPGEGGTKTPTNPDFARVNLNLHKVTGLCYVTEELIEDSPIAIEPLLRRLFGQAINFVQDSDYLVGDGVNKPLGAFNSANPSLITATAETGQGANTIVWENIVNMWSRLYPAGHQNAVWVAHPETFPQLSKMAVAVGTGGVPVWIPGQSASNAPYTTLMGRPLIISEKMQALGTAGDIGLADFSQYLTGEKGDGLKTASSMHVRFVTDEMAFRFVLRYDGQPWWTTTLTPIRGSNTYSPFIILSGTRT